MITQINGNTAESIQISQVSKSSSIIVPIEILTSCKPGEELIV